MHFHLAIFIYLFLVSKNCAKLVEIKCPSHCKCDIFEKLKRATCVNRNLAVVESNLPNQTEILDLSYNQISHLESSTFKEQHLLSLKLLNISHNKVSQIHMNAFEGLNKLKTLDLSYNAMQYIFQKWFWSLKSIEELYLRQNSFKIIGDEPFIKSKTLRILDLSKCQTIHIGDNALLELPKLEILDVSENNLIHLTMETIKPLENLRILNVQNNTLSCDGVLQNLSNFCTQKGIRFQDPCQKKISAFDKFERIVNMAEPEDEKNSWIYDDEENVKNVTVITQKCNNTESDPSLLREIVNLSPALSIIIPLVYGIAVGILIGCTVQIYPRNHQEDTDQFTYVSFQEDDPHLRRRNKFSRSFSKEERESLPLKEWKLSESTPVLFRKNQVY